MNLIRKENTKRDKYKLKEILKEDRKDRNITEFGLEDKICTLLQIYHIKREAWFGGDKLNEVNYRRFMDQYKVIINNIRDIFIEINKGTVVEENINLYCDKHKQNLNEMHCVYRCMRSLNITDDLIS